MTISKTKQEITDEQAKLIYNQVEVTWDPLLESSGLCFGSVSYTHLDVYKRQFKHKQIIICIQP